MYCECMHAREHQTRVDSGIHGDKDGGYLGHAVREEGGMENGVKSRGVSGTIIIK